MQIYLIRIFQGLKHRKFHFFFLLFYYINIQKIIKIYSLKKKKQFIQTKNFNYRLQYVLFVFLSINFESELVAFIVLYFNLLDLFYMHIQPHHWNAIIFFSHSFEKERYLKIINLNKVIRNYYFYFGYSFFNKLRSPVSCCHVTAPKKKIIIVLFVFYFVAYELSHHLTVTRR